MDTVLLVGIAADVLGRGGTAAAAYDCDIFGMEGFLVAAFEIVRENPRRQFAKEFGVLGGSAGSVSSWTVGD
jgi:hypothetical protein